MIKHANTYYTTIAIALDVITDKNIWNHEIRIKVR